MFSVSISELGPVYIQSIRIQNLTENKTNFLVSPCASYKQDLDKVVSVYLSLHDDVVITSLHSPLQKAPIKVTDTFKENTGARHFY